MRRRVKIAEPASDELNAAVQWYEDKRPGLGAQLFDAVVATIQSIEEQPEIGVSIHPDPQTRRVLVARFPYQVVYHLHQSEVVVVAIAHLKRRPEYWRRRS